MRYKKRLLICDLDNTLYDWVHYFVSAFYAMVDEVVKLTGCERNKLLDDFKRVHQHHHDSEHPFALLETETIRKLYEGQSLREVAYALDSAFHAFNSKRKETLAVHPGVHEGLAQLMSEDVRLVAHTESKLFAVVDRMTRLDLVKYFARIYCRERPASDHPDPQSVEHWLDRFPMERVVELSRHQRKPDADVLREICKREALPESKAAYVGDSIARDILMAKKANVYAIWAKYGTHHTAEDYERLVRVSHWTTEDVRREKQLQEEARAATPDCVAEESFTEVAEAVHCSSKAAVP